MRTYPILFLGLLILAFVAASPAEAQPGYCGWECSHVPPISHCDQPCLQCPGTCIEYQDVGCPDCAYWSTCGAYYPPPNCLQSSGFSGPAPLFLPILPNLITSTEPDPKRQRALLPLQVAPGLCASGGDNSPRP